MTLALTSLAEFASVQGLSQAATAGLVSAVWQGILLAAAAALGLRLLPRMPAAVRFAIWFAVFLVVMALPLVSLWPHTAAARADGHAAWLTLDDRWSLAILAVWAAASLVRAGTLVVAAFRVRALWRRAEPVEIGLPEGPRSAQICVSDEVDRPSVIGFFAPKILIPRWLLEKLTAAELEQIVLHEAGHLGRADDWLNLAQKIALVLFPLNPALVWVERRLCFERELACDERVLRATGAPKAYAACLAALAEHRMGRRVLALSLGALGRESELARRVRRILRPGEWMRPMQARLVLGAAILGLLGGAVELSRCPQVVAFSPEIRAASVVASGQQIGLTRAAGYQAVRFNAAAIHGYSNDLGDRSKGSHEILLKASIPSIPSRQATQAHVTTAVTTKAVSRLAAQRMTLTSASGVDDVEDYSTRQGRGMVRWFVVTSWDGADGSRLVLTTAGFSAAQAATKVAPAAVMTGEQPEAQPAQVYPYAVVPVRGGWLVFQL